MLSGKCSSQRIGRRVEFDGLGLVYIQNPSDMKGILQLAIRNRDNWSYSNYKIMTIFYLQKKR